MTTVTVIHCVRKDVLYLSAPAVNRRLVTW